MSTESNSQTIIRKAKTKDFTIIDNSILRDTRLSWKAKGLLCYFLHLPDNWKLNCEHLEKQSSDGQSSLRSGVNELKEYGYLTIERERDGKGLILRSIWLVHENPITHTSEPQVENQIVDTRRVDNRTLLSTKRNQILKERNTCASKAVASVPKFSKSKKEKPSASLTEEQKQKLIEKYGKEDTVSAIEYLKDWKESKSQMEPGAVDKHTDYHRIVKWVMSAIQDQKTKQKPHGKCFRSPKERISGQFKNNEEYNGYFISYDEFAVTLTPKTGQSYRVIKYSENGFWQLFCHECRKRAIPVKE